MTVDQLLVAFFVFLAISVVTLFIAMGLAVKHKTNAHIGTVWGFVALLLVTLYFAETLGTHYDFETTSITVHLSIAVVTSISLPVVLTSGFLHWRGKVSLKTHKVLVGIWLVMVFASLGTGGWMLSAADRKVAPGSEQAPTKAG